MVCARASTSVPRFASGGHPPRRRFRWPRALTTASAPPPAPARFLRLRTAHRIIGAMVAGRRRFRQQAPCTASPQPLRRGHPGCRRRWVGGPRPAGAAGSAAMSLLSMRKDASSPLAGPKTDATPRRAARGMGRQTPRLAHNAGRIKGAPPGGADWETFLQAAHIAATGRLRDPRPRRRRRFSVPPRERTQISGARWTPLARPPSVDAAVFADLHARTGLTRGPSFEGLFSRLGRRRPHGVPREFHRARVRGERGSARVDVTGGGANVARRAEKSRVGVRGGGGGRGGRRADAPHRFDGDGDIDIVPRAGREQSSNKGNRG